MSLTSQQIINVINQLETQGPAICCKRKVDHLDHDQADLLDNHSPGFFLTHDTPKEHNADRINSVHIDPQQHSPNTDSNGYHLTMIVHGSPQSDPFMPSAQPMHDQSWRQDACIYGLEGRELPAGTPQVCWFNNVVTPLPFVAAQAGITPEQVSPLLHLI